MHITKAILTSKRMTKAQKNIVQAMTELSDDNGITTVKNQTEIAKLAGYSREYTNAQMRKLEWHNIIEKLAPTFDGKLRYQINAAEIVEDHDYYSL